MNNESSRSPVTEALAAYAAGEVPPRPVEKAAVKLLLDRLTDRAPGRSVEVRVPPYAAVQCVAGTTHTRGTPPNEVEMSARTWLLLATGGLSWDDALETGQVRASGSRADISAYLPL